MNEKKQELNLDLLEKITGGIVGESEEFILTSLIRSVKKVGGQSMDDVIDFLSTADLYGEQSVLKKTNIEEAVEYCRNNWDSIE